MQQPPLTGTLKQHAVRCWNTSLGFCAKWGKREIYLSCSLAAEHTTKSNRANYTRGLISIINLSSMSHTESQRLAFFSAILPPSSLKIKVKRWVPSTNFTSIWESKIKLSRGVWSQSDKYLLRLAHTQPRTASLNGVWHVISKQQTLKDHNYLCHKINLLWFITFSFGS